MTSILVKLINASVDSTTSPTVKCQCSRAVGQQPEMLGCRRWNDVLVVDRGGRCQKIGDLDD